MSQFSFFKEFLRSPRGLGALTPSSRNLGHKVVEAATIRPADVVIELGAGTGPLTEQVLARWPGLSFTAIEPHPPFASVLREKFHMLDVAERPAQDVKEILTERGISAVDAIISSLPWAIWPEPLLNEVMDNVVAVMKPGARLVSVSYVHLQPFAPARRLRNAIKQRLEQFEIHSVSLMNLPPALVFRAIKR